MGLSWPNLWQGSEERSNKYNLCLSLGANASWARRMRDWHYSKIMRYFNLDEKALNLQGIDPELL